MGLLTYAEVWMQKKMAQINCKLPEKIFHIIFPRNWNIY
jgi:hypothetical protein